MAIVRDASGNLPDSLNGTSGADQHISSIESVDRSFPVVCSDTIDLPNGITEALSVTTAGAYKVSYANGTTDSPYLAAGLWHPMNVKRVWSTGSVATAGVSAGY